jgi:Glutaredoxin-like domain (DUF836)
MAAVTLTLLGRAYCSLCDEMREALTPIAARHGANVVELDVDADAVLEEAYGDLVPVLLAGAWGNTREICHHRLDVAAVEQALRAPG